jgi:hypothetical protein
VHWCKYPVSESEKIGVIKAKLHPKFLRMGTKKERMIIALR